MWKFVALVLGAFIGNWLMDDFQPGASSGIGEQMAYHYARLGASVVVTARREHRLKEVVAKCKKIGSLDQTYDYVVADMSHLNSTHRVLHEAISKLGRLDILVLNHMRKFDLGVWNGSAGNLSHIDSVFNVNFQSYAYLASHSLSHIEATAGSLIVVSSLVGKMAQPFFTLYSASKFALDGFFSGLRQELKIKNSKISLTLCILGFVGRLMFLQTSCLK